MQVRPQLLQVSESQRELSSGAWLAKEDEPFPSKPKTSFIVYFDWPCFCEQKRKSAGNKILKILIIKITNINWPLDIFLLLMFLS